jgi:hypothetical protein
MPLSKHFAGKGEKVMRAMRKTYHGKSADEIEAIFYATENARKKHRLKKAMRGKR